MTETSYSAVGHGPARTCLSCGGRLPGPALRCPRCGAVAGQRSGGAAKTLIIILAIVFGSMPVLGILAAIAIPNFIRYQLRSKAQEVPSQLAQLSLTERASYEGRRQYVAFGPIPSAGRPGREKLALSAEDVRAAAEADWVVEGGLYGRYRAVVAQDGAGNQAAALCGETDLDGDGTPARWVVFLPVEGAGEALAPDAPCSTPVPYQTGWRSGQVVQITEPNVF